MFKLENNCSELAQGSHWVGLSRPKADAALTKKAHLA